jgi:hypothetical protein
MTQEKEAVKGSMLFLVGRRDARGGGGEGAVLFLTGRR